jgi:hypothetical protein
VELGEAVLKLGQLRDVTMNDPELMREVLARWRTTWAGQLQLLETAIRDGDSQKRVR